MKICYEVLIMHEKIVDIQNSFWKAYKDFIKTNDMCQYNDDLKIITSKYKGDKVMFNFCFNLLCSWAPIINQIKEQAL